MTIGLDDPSGLLIDTASPIDYSWGPNTGLVARYQSVPNPGWDGGVKIKDLCRRQADGTLTNMAFPPTSTSGWSRQTHRGGYGSLTFDGTNDYVTTNRTTPVSAGFVSYGCWIKTTGVVGARIINKDNNSTQREIDSFLNSTGTMSTFIWNQAGTSGSTTTVATFNSGAWTHFFATWDGTTIRNYRNGVQASTGSLIGTSLFASTSTLEFARFSNNSNFVNGSLNDIRIFNRALSAREVMAIYLDSLAGSPSSLNWMVDDDYIMPSSSPAPATSNAFWFAAP